jgi:hypothetical protein
MQRRPPNQRRTTRKAGALKTFGYFSGRFVSFILAVSWRWHLGQDSVQPVLQAFTQREPGPKNKSRAGVLPQIFVISFLLFAVAVGRAQTTAEVFENDPAPPARIGTPYVLLDSWVYPALERLAALGYIRTAFIGLKPWTRMECARLVAQAREEMIPSEEVQPFLLDLQLRLEKEFAYELRLMDGDRNAAARIESVYARVVSVSGEPLSDGYHFGQTLSYDWGRPLRRGTNLQFGASVSAAIGPAAIFLRGEVQHAPSTPPLSSDIRNFIATRDQVPLYPATALHTFNRGRLLDAYLAVNLRGTWQLSVGKQSLSWGPGTGSFLWSNNIEPIPMVRLTESETWLPGPLKLLGPARFDNFVGRLQGHNYVPRPYIYGNKISFKPHPNLELGFGRTVTIGGQGGTPLTTGNLLLSFFGQTSSKLNSVPGDSHSSFDWTFYIPRIRNQVVFYGELYADDDFLPFQNPPRNPFRTGIYLVRLPGAPKLEARIEAASTESPGAHGPESLNYWNVTYRDGYTSNGNLIGNTVGRMGRSIQCEAKYWISALHALQFTYRHNTISGDFVPQGGAWQAYGVNHEIQLRSGLYLKAQVQYEHIRRYPILFSGARNNTTAVVELGWLPPRSE